uniref:Uncharacterized protein, PA2063/DUF2235 family n=1 Tax=Candidatus Kentrum sp. TUN TaxID=2126343 RepID=A0A450ZRY5_9GAMM|nr:MAG: Uncharacterized protein, PA2063/DUF2235 family [Candidatus Kentron sp. TUN]VFK62795.1 MAG: Uncharacterized protein, PA2063/DUF2235 family [Candidatus Kentron sp. TUN]
MASENHTLAIETGHLSPCIPVDSMKGPSKNLILCSDGTGNRGGVTPDTNVWRLFQSIDHRGHQEENSNIPEQITFYSDGVGTEELKWLKYFGGAFGWGLSRNIREMYTFLVKNYQPGDKIFLFSFSRGAFTVRSLAGIIARCGIIKEPWKIEEQWKIKGCEDLTEYVKHTYYAYKYAHFRKQDNPTDKELEKCGIEYRTGWRVETHYDEIGRDQKNAAHVPIHFIGVWDTVDAVGMPVDELRDALAWSIQTVAWCSDWALRKLPVLKFSGHTLQSQVRNACHALAIDDERQTFHPVLWRHAPTNPDMGNITNQRVEQVWFCGMHSNIGGGYAKDQLAHVPLNWMLDRAKKCGLGIIKDSWKGFRSQADSHGRMYDSRSGLAIYYRYHPRNIAKLWEKVKNDPSEHPVLVHESVLERIARTTQEYAPVSLPTDFQIVTCDDQEKPKSLEDWISQTPNFKPAPKWKEERKQGLQEAWQAICNGRLLYFFFIAVTLLFALVLSRLDSGGPGASGDQCLVINWLNIGVQKFAPDLVAEYIDALFLHPVWLGFFVGVLAIIFRLRAWFRWRVRFHAQQAWCAVRPVYLQRPPTKTKIIMELAWTITVVISVLMLCYWFSPWI